jgi:hypothetical protein
MDFMRNYSKQVNTVSDIIKEIEDDEKNGYYATYYYTWS